MRLIIEPDYSSLSNWAANYVAKKINAANPTKEKPFVLGLPTGSSPLGMYKALIELNKKGVVSFKNVVTFNMDEYAGIDPQAPQGQSLGIRHRSEPPQWGQAPLWWFCPNGSAAVPKRLDL